MKNYGLRVRNDFIPISQEDYENACDERNLIKKRLQKEMLFDQLLTNVIEWHESMVRFAGRTGSSKGANTWKHYRECGLMLRLANVLSACVSFTDNSKEHQCRKPMCTIAKELRNQLQHSEVDDLPVIKWTSVWIETPQMKSMPSNFRKTGVGLRVRWRGILDDIRPKKRRERFERACKQAFPTLDEVDTVIVINNHLRCLSDVMSRERQEMGSPDELLGIHAMLLKKAVPLTHGSGLISAASPEDEEIYLEGARHMVTEIKELMDRNQELPDLELVQFGEGSPTQGNLRMLYQRIERLLKATGRTGLSLSEACVQLSIDRPEQEKAAESFAKVIRRVSDRSLDEERELWKSSLWLRQVESKLAALTTDDVPQ